MWGTSLLLPAVAVIAAAIGATSAGCAPVERHFGTGGEGGTTTGSHTTGSAGGGGATSSSSSGSTGGGGATSSSSSSSSGGGVETDCTNGLDDDGDGLTDCADPDCTGIGYQCAADAPSGWSGPALLYTGADTPPACDAGWTERSVVGGLDVKAGPAICEACSCGAPSGVVCDPNAQLFFAGSPSCNNGASQIAPFGQCISSPAPSQKFIKVVPPTAGGGSCTPSGGAGALSPAAYGTQAAVCDMPAGAGAGCNAGVCVPKAPTGYGPSLCVYQSGDVECPGAPYANKTLVYTTIVDKRACSPCACDVPTGSTCDAQVLTFSVPLPGGCPGTQTGIFPADGNCRQMPNGPYPYLAAEVEPNGGAIGGSCAPSGGKPTGAAGGGQPTTVCCQ